MKYWGKLEYRNITNLIKTGEILYKYKEELMNSKLEILFPFWGVWSDGKKLRKSFNSKCSDFDLIHR